MTEASAAQAASDLEFLKQVVHRRDAKRTLSPRWLALMWGAILLVGCTWNDLSPRTCWMFWAVVPALAFVLSSLFHGKESFMSGEHDSATGQKMGLHWSTCFFGGVPVVVLAFNHRIDGYTAGQLFILVSGIVYYLGGVHFDKRWIAPGLVMIAGAALLAARPPFGWTIVGAMACLALVISFWRDPRPATPAA